MSAITVAVFPIDWIPVCSLKNSILSVKTLIFRICDVSVTITSVTGISLSQMCHRSVTDSKIDGLCGGVEFQMSEFCIRPISIQDAILPDANFIIGHSGIASGGWPIRSVTGISLSQICHRSEKSRLLFKDETFETENQYPIESYDHSGGAV